MALVTGNILRWALCRSPRSALAGQTGASRLFAGGELVSASPRAAELRSRVTCSAPRLPKAAADVGRGAASFSSSASATAGNVPVTKGASMMSAAGAALVMTPETSLIGGLTVGVSAAGKLATTGRITGISGTYGGLLRGSFDGWRIAYLGGMLGGGLLAQQLMPGCIQVLPDSYTLLRAVAAGLLVGYGTALGSGCTSGHGICGLARFSKRSLAAVMTFMATGAIVAMMAQTAVAAGVPASLATPWPGATAQQLQSFGTVLGGSVAVTALIAAIAKAQVLPAAALGIISEFVFGGIFALGLAAGGMLAPAKVAAFLSPLASYFDPSLMCVMGGALLVTTPAFQFFMRGGKVPSCAKCLDLPNKTAIDGALLMGSAMFGAGWGLGGYCPGPALVSLSQPTPQNVAFVVAMTAGMMLQARRMTFMAAQLKRAA